MLSVSPNPKILTAMTKKEIIEDLRDKVADIKYECQVVLDILDSLYHEYDE